MTFQFEKAFNLWGMKKAQLDEIIRKHKDWLNGVEGGERANLSEANLSEANLSGADLSEANLSEANLSEANLSGANLSVADLSEANLSVADLSGANLSRANLSEANLSEANLSGADLRWANLSGADLSVAKSILSCGPMPTSGRMIYAVWHSDKWLVKAGCFWGELDALESAVNSKHKCPMYLGIINLLRNYKPNQ